MYKEIVLKYDKKLNARDLSAIALFNDRFRENEIRLAAKTLKRRYIGIDVSDEYCAAA